MNKLKIIFISIIFFYSCKEKCADCKKYREVAIIGIPSTTEISGVYEICGDEDIKNAEQKIVVPYNDTNYVGEYREYSVCSTN